LSSTDGLICLFVLIVIQPKALEKPRSSGILAINVKDPIVY